MKKSVELLLLAVVMMVIGALSWAGIEASPTSAGGVTCKGKGRQAVR